MPQSNPEAERKVLAQLHDDLNDPEVARRRGERMQRLAFGAGYALLLAGLLLALGRYGDPVIGTLIAALGGAGIGFGLFLRESLRQWSITRRHVDRESVSRRIAELQLADDRSTPG